MVKPPTAGVNILSIDGGGIRGVIPLEFLNRLQKVLGPDCPVQDLFDLALGTSSGGLIVLSLFLQCWNVPRCINLFDKLVKEFFQQQKQATPGFLNRCRYILRCWLSDGYYSVEALEKCLQDTFGMHRRMFDSLDVVSGTKVAVTASTISNASCYVFSNYNGLGRREKDCGYRHLRPANIEDEPYIWQAGRATSAAPVLFQSARISNVGTFQDGGLKHNNPVNLALWESRQIWPSISQPDLVLSLGTGTEIPKSPSAPHFRHVFRDGFLPRIYRSFMSSLDGQNTWRDFVNHLDDESRRDYIRLNISLPTELLALDDESQMERLRQSVHLQFPLEQDDLETAFAIMVSRFFFELDAIPERDAFESANGPLRSEMKRSAMWIGQEIHVGYVIDIGNELSSSFGAIQIQSQFFSRTIQFILDGLARFPIR
ncbi:hypothetical protein MMC13_001815 [Lambiella insularis]|nr:hypothetical protein [Lambiella insularis]